MAAPRLFTYGGRRGDEIVFLPDFVRGALVQGVVGHKVLRPRTGDLLLVPLDGDVLSVWRFSSVEPSAEQPGLFFGRVEYAGTRDEAIPPA
jgi:hypothetical protein